MTDEETLALLAVTHRPPPCEVPLHAATAAGRSHGRSMAGHLLAHGQTLARCPSLLFTSGNAGNRPLLLMVPGSQLFVPIRYASNLLRNIRSHRLIQASFKLAVLL